MAALVSTIEEPDFATGVSFQTTSLIERDATRGELLRQYSIRSRVGDVEIAADAALRALATSSWRAGNGVRA